MCRAALLQANHDAAKARALLDDSEFVRMNTDGDLGDLARLAAENPMKMVESMMARHAGHAGKSEAELGYDVKQVRAAAEVYERQKPKLEAYEKQVEEAKGRKVNDPVFGELTWDTFWEGEVDVPGFGKLRLSIDADAEAHAVATPPGDAHRQAMTRFLAAAQRLRPRIEKANFEYFQRVRENYAEGGGDVPDVREPADIWKEHFSPALHIPVQDGEAWRVELNWECSWDEEHGHAVYIEGGKVVNVSIQGDGYESE
jgi:hypothetical protein